MGTRIACLLFICCLLSLHQIAEAVLSSSPQTLCGWWLSDPTGTYSVGNATLAQTLYVNTSCTNAAGTNQSITDITREASCTIAPGSTLAFIGISPESKIFDVYGPMRFQTSGSVVANVQASLASTAVWQLSNFVPLVDWRIKTDAPCGVPQGAQSISTCPTGFACRWDASTSSVTYVSGVVSYCILGVKVTSTIVPSEVSNTFYTFKLDQDCVKWNQSLFVNLVVAAMNSSTFSAANLETYPPTCGSVFQPFRCKSTDAVLASALCDNIVTQAATPGTNMNKNLKFLDTWKEDTFVSHNQQASSNPALFGLLVLLILPFLLIPLVFMMMKKNQASEPAKEIDTQPPPMPSQPYVTTPPSTPAPTITRPNSPPPPPTAPGAGGEQFC